MLGRQSTLNLRPQVIIHISKLFNPSDLFESRNYSARVIFFIVKMITDNLLSD